MPSHTPSAHRTRRPPSIDRLILEYMAAHVGEVVSAADLEQYLFRRRSEIPRRWHQRISELRIEHGYDIHSANSRQDLKPGEYLLTCATPVHRPNPRVKVSAKLRLAVVDRDRCCQFVDPASGRKCGLFEGDTDPYTHQLVKLTADHITPHSAGGRTTLGNLQAMCRRHQSKKRNRYDGDKPDLMALLREAPIVEKERAYDFLALYFDNDKLRHTIIVESKPHSTSRADVILGATRAEVRRAARALRMLCSHDERAEDLLTRFDEALTTDVDVMAVELTERQSAAAAELLPDPLNVRVSALKADRFAT